jgi:hypothetical protein
MDEIYGNPYEPKEKRVNRHGYVRQGLLEDFPLVNKIHNAIFAKRDTVILPDPTEENPKRTVRVVVQGMAGGTIRGVDFKGIRYVEQNPAKNSPYAKRSRPYSEDNPTGEDAKIIWVFKGGNYIGLIDNGVVWKDPKHIKQPTHQPAPGVTTVIHIRNAPVGWKTNPLYVYIGRRNFAEQLPRSKWCNPRPLRTQEPQEREENLRRFAEDFENSPLRQQVGEQSAKRTCVALQRTSRTRRCANRWENSRERFWSVTASPGPVTVIFWRVLLTPLERSHHGCR